MKYYKSSIIYFAINLSIFLVIDTLNMPYNQMLEMHGWWLVIVNVILTLLMSSIATKIFSDSLELFEKYGTNTNGENVSIIAMVFALLTYGCTPCVIGIFASLGVTFSVYVLPFEGLPYKVIALILLVFGMIITKKSIENKECRLKEN